MDVENNLEVKVLSNVSEQEDTSDDDDEPEDTYANGLLADENWLAQYEAEREKEQELNGLASIVISTGDEEEACSLLLLRCVVTGSTHKL